MSKAIYLVTSKKTTEVLEKELKRKNGYSTRVLRKLKKVMPEIKYAAAYGDSWNGGVYTRGVIFNDDYVIDNKLWKKLDRVQVGNYLRNSYWPKCNTKAGKALAAKLGAASKSEKFFQSDEISDLLKYKPKEKVSDVTAGTITVNTLQFGYKKTKGKPTKFLFGGYKGYVPPRGVKELLTSEYNKLMGK